MMEATSPLPRRLRPVVASLLLVVVAAWLVAMHQRESQRLEWRAARQQGNDAIALHANPPTVEGRIERAVVLTERLFPPDRTAATGELTRALADEPLRSRAWFHVARTQLFAGRSEAARAALERADALDPWFPGQRLRSIQLWSLLGEEDRAVALAQSLANMGPRQQRIAATELVVMGIAPRRAWELVAPDDIDPLAAGRLLLALGSLDAPAMRSVMEVIPPRLHHEPEFRDLLLRRLRDPFVPELLAALWEDSHGPLVGLGVLPLENPSLALPPFRAGLALGWIPPPAKVTFEASWVSPEVAGGSGFLRLQIPPLADRATWAIYRGLVEEVEGVPRVGLLLRTEGDANARAWVTLRQGSSSVRSEAVRLGSEVQFVGVRPSLAGAPLEIVLDVRVERGSRPGRVLVLISGVETRDPEATP